MEIYDVCVEHQNPCGGAAHGRKEFIEVETDDPVAYAVANSQWPLIEANESANGDLVVTTGDGNGYVTRFIFSL